MFSLSIVTPEKIFYEGQVASLIVPGSEGYLGTLSDHAPLITAIVPGRVDVRDAEGQEMIMAVSDGFFEISSNKATLLVDTVEFASDIDPKQARESLKLARQKLTEAAGPVELDLARKALEQAKNRVRVAESEVD